MDHMVPTGCLKRQSLLNDMIIYHYNNAPFASLLSFDDALELTTWRVNLKPFACAIANPH